MSSPQETPDAATTKAPPSKLSAQVLLFPSFAYLVPERRQWRVDLQGVAFKSRPKKLKRKLLIKVLQRLMDVPPSQLTSDLFHQRTTIFFCGPYKSKKILVQIGDQSIVLRRRTKRNGQFRARLKLSMDQAERLTAYFENSDFSARATTVNGKSKSCSQPVRFIPPKGVSVISDIDDTIKESHVENRSELLANTFIREFRSVSGMADVYQWLAARQVEFHYVSTSPWQLFHPIQQMLIDCGFPPGSIHLRTYRLSDPVLKRLGVIHRGGKAGAIARILARFPQRKFLLIGDSGEKDLQIYSHIYRLRPNQVSQILIRLVRPEHRYRESVIEAKMTLPQEIFGLFESPVELRSILESSIQ